jgi:phosphatidylglycerol:prolipoprotein diacylglycerol transferase
MLRVLLQIPQSVTLGGREVALFGPLGLVQLAWIIPWLVAIARRAMRSRWDADTARMIGTLAVGAIGIAIVPRIAPASGIPIYGFGAMLFVGFLAAGWISARLGRSAGFNPNDIWDVAMWVFIAGIVGSRLFFVVQYHDRFESLADVANITQGGLVYYGGVIAAVIVFMVYARLKQLPALALCDVLAPGVALGLAFGRIGCFLNGCCYGDATTLAWGVHFPPDSVPFEAMVDRGLIDAGAASTPALHPAQLYSAIDGVILCALLLAYYPWRRRSGQVIALLLVAYPVTRFLIEYLRADEYALATGLTISQNVSALLFPIGVVFWTWLQTHPQPAAGHAEVVEPRGRRDQMARRR